MQQTRGQHPCVRTRDEFTSRIDAGARSLNGWRVHDVDLHDRAAVLETVDVAGALFVGCGLSPEQAAQIRARGAVVFSTVPGVPVHLDRRDLYTARDLYDTPAYADSLDARAYAWSHAAPALTTSASEALDPALPRTLHDHAIDAALERWRQGRSIVGVMGGHALARGTDAYGVAARLGRALGRTHTVATGGGPGAMEAANLGGYFSAYEEGALAEALQALGHAPSFSPQVDPWVRAAFDVLERFPEGNQTLGIPTWHYGHEPPNPFATAIAKYFGNATREAVLLEICDAGIVFLPGAGGTVQEIFQDACENYYADESSVAPMVLVGREFWTVTLPAWPLLRALSRGRAMEEHVHLVDTAEEAAALISG